MLEERVLAYGEATGHAHRVDAAAALYEKDGHVYMQVAGDACLTHEEHHTITQPDGWYEVVRQREYTPEEARYVVGSSRSQAAGSTSPCAMPAPSTRPERGAASTSCMSVPSSPRPSAWS